MSLILMLVGLVFLIVGGIVFCWPLRTSLQPQGVSLDTGKVLEEINKMLEKLDKRFRPGLIMMFFGLTLICLAVFLRSAELANLARQ